DVVDRIDLADDVGGVRQADGAHLAVEQLVEIGEVQAAALLVDAPLADVDAVGAELAPGAGIGLVSLVGDDDGVAGLRPAGAGVAAAMGVGRGGGPEMGPVAAGVGGLRRAPGREVHRLAGLAGGGIEAVGLHLGGPVVVLHAVK